MSETAVDIITKVEAMTMIVIDQGHCCQFFRFHAPVHCFEVFICEAARWLPEQIRYGPRAHATATVSDREVAEAADVGFLYADAAYQVLREVLKQLDLWAEAEKVYRQGRDARPVTLGA